MSEAKGQSAAPESAVVRHIRVSKAESAFIYAIFEAHEGVLAYTTLPTTPGVPHCDLVLQIPTGMLEDAEILLRGLGDLIYPLDPSEL